MSEVLKSSKLIQYWRRASLELDFSLIEGAELELESGKNLKTILLVEGYGAEKGMLFLSSEPVTSDEERELISKGYGYTRMPEPLESEEFDIEDYKEILDDWGKSDSA